MLNFQELATNGSFCILPFIHQEKKFNGTYHICCYGDQLQSDNIEDNSEQSFNSTKMQSIRNDMIAGVRPQACQSCYSQEDRGISSPRHRENQTWSAWYDTQEKIQHSLDNYTNGISMIPISYDLRYSNTCTLKCRMCNSSSSSALNAEYKKIQNLWPEKFWTVDNPRINHDIRLDDNVVKIYLAGGEPLVEPYNLELLKKLASYNTEVALLINTSLNNLTDNFLEVLNNFKNLTLVVSIDGVGKTNDYIRHGSNFDTVMLNLNKLAHHGLMFSTCVSVYNIFNLPNLIKFVNKQYPNSVHGIHLVNDIPELFVENVPLELRNNVISNLNECLETLTLKEFTAQGIQNIITTLQSKNFNKSNFDNFIRYTNILDKTRNESIIDVVPELTEYFNATS